MKRRRGRKRARGSRTSMLQATRSNPRWSLDFLVDSFGASRTFRILAVNDDCCRKNLCLAADTSISGERVARELDALVRNDGKPACIVSDNRTEFTRRAIQKWADRNGVDWYSIDPGKPKPLRSFRHARRRYNRGPPQPLAHSRASRKPRHGSFTQIHRKRFAQCSPSILW